MISNSVWISMCMIFLMLKKFSPKQVDFMMLPMVCLLTFHWSLLHIQRLLWLLHIYIGQKRSWKIKKSFILQIDIMVQLKSYLIWSFLNITMLLEENLIFIKNRLLSCNLMMNGLKLKSMINGLKDSDFH